MTAYEQAKEIINVLREYIPESILKASYVEDIGETTGQLIITFNLERSEDQ